MRYVRKGPVAVPINGAVRGMGTEAVAKRCRAGCYFLPER